MPVGALTTAWRSLGSLNLTRDVCRRLTGRPKRAEPILPFLQ